MGEVCYESESHVEQDQVHILSSDVFPPYFHLALILGHFCQASQGFHLSPLTELHGYIPGMYSLFHYSVGDYTSQDLSFHSQDDTISHIYHKHTISRV